MDTMSTIKKMKAVVEIHQQIAEVKRGVRGYISATLLAKHAGIKKEFVAKWATEAGLVCENHGRFGLCFSRA